MRRPELSLRARFLFASFALSAVLITGFALAVYQFIEHLEEEFVTAGFKQNFTNFVLDFTRDGALRVPREPGFEGFAVDASGLRALPAALRAIPPGVHMEIAIDDRLYAVGRRAVREMNLFLLRDLELEPVEQLEQRLLEIALGATAVALLLGAVLAVRLSNLVLAPVHSLARAVAGLTPGQARRPLPGVGDDLELAIIARAFDETLARYDAFAARERAFTRDASHELRTPLAVMRSSIQLIEQDCLPGTAQGLRLGRLRAATAQMQALLEALLFLARTDTGATAGAPHSVADLIEEAVDMQYGASGTIEYRVRIVADWALELPRGLLLSVVNNLLRNAVAHADSSRVDITLRGPLLIIEDFGQGIPGELVDRAFERGVRGVASGGEGWGLELVQRICTRLGWLLDLRSAPGQGTRVEILMRSEAALVAETSNCRKELP